MKFAFGVLYICFLKVVNSHDSESTEVNGIEVTPFYDTIIVNDIADLLNEFKNTNSLFDSFMHSESESDENVENLLSEYHNYLEKAHNQRKMYLEKTKIKNKVPLLRHDKYVKTKPVANANYSRYYYKNFFNPSGAKFPPVVMTNPLDLLATNNPKQKKPDIVNNRETAGNYAIDTFMREKGHIDGPVTVLNPGQGLITSSCYCKSGQFPCKCGCKQCLLPFDVFTFNHNDAKFMLLDKKLPDFQRDSLYTDKLRNIEYVPDDVLNDSGNNINIRVKVDIQLPKLQDAGERYYKNYNHDRTIEPEINSKEISTINLPLPYFNFPIPMDLLGFKKSSAKFNKHDNVHQITIHRKKKSRSNINKKHRKKLITFHDYKITSLAPPIIIEENNNYSNINDHLRFNNNGTLVSNKINKSQTQNLEYPAILVNVTDETAELRTIPTFKNDNQIQDTNSKVTLRENNLKTNLSNKSGVDRDDSHRIGNSIETETMKRSSFNVTEENSTLRVKREIKNQNNTTTTKMVIVVKQNNNTQKSVPGVSKDSSSNIDIKKIDKIIVGDSELLYWPNIILNKTISGTKNITTLILEREIKNNKLNISTETIRHNHTKALEQAIFGKVDWNDVDTVVPTFISFVGKYIRGVLTLCSQKVCHSIKCQEKKCIHRICEPENRLNKKGHCIGSNATDSVASMEPIMDLPSNVAFEIVDIMQYNMLGKLFGKMTLCINSKCSTFLTCKKHFMKSKCITKDLDKTGHCPNVKNVKIM